MRSAPSAVVGSGPRSGSGSDPGSGSGSAAPQLSVADRRRATRASLQAAALAPARELPQRSTRAKNFEVPRENEFWGAEHSAASRRAPPPRRRTRRPARLSTSHPARFSVLVLFLPVARLRHGLSLPPRCLRP
jgi:hypothetical protein